MKKLLLCLMVVFLLVATSDQAQAYNKSWDGNHPTGGLGGPNPPTPDGNSDGGGRGRGGGDEVDLATGNLTYTRIDVSIPARGPDLGLSRTYHTQEEYVGPFGRRWHCNWDAKVVLTQDGDQQQITVFNLGGQLGIRKTFTESGGDWVGPPGYHATLTVNPDDTVTVTTKYGIVYQFASLTAGGLSPPAGFLTSVTDRNGNAATVTYDGSGRISVVTDSSGRTLAFTYGSLGHVERVTDPASRQFHYTYDANHNLTQCTDALGMTRTYQYDSDNRLVAIVDPAGTAWLANVYDSDNRVVRQFYDGGYFDFEYGGTADAPTCTVTDRNGVDTDYVMNAAGQVTSETIDRWGLNIAGTYAYDSDLNLISYTDPNGNVTTYEYDAVGNLTRNVDAQGNETVRTYESTYNRVASVTDALGRTATWAYDGSGNLTTATDTIGNVTTYTYGTNGDMLTFTDALGNTRTHEYDTYGNETRTTDALGGVDTFAYDTLGNVLSTTDPLGRTTTYAYDLENQLTAVTDAGGGVTSYAYDANGNETSITWATGLTATFVYDVYGRLIAEVDRLGNVTQYAYDANDNVVTVTDAEGNATSRTYDAGNRLIAETDALGQVTQYGCNKTGTLAGVTDAQGNETTYSYDSLNRLTQTTYADSSTETYTYNTVGKRVAKTLRSGDTITYTYDDFDRLVSKTYPDASTADFTYDPLGRLLSATDSDSTVSYVFDALGRLSQTTQNGKIVGYEHDAVGNKTKITYPGGDYVTCTYDATNLLAQVKDSAAAIISSFTYDAAGRRTQLDLANGTQTAYTYDAAGRLASLDNREIAPGPTISSFGYTYDNVGNPLSIATLPGTHTYTYDAIHQVTSVDYPDGYGFADTTYNYDQVGNRISVVDGGAVAYTHNNLNQYTNVGGTAYTYDPNGNLTSDGVSTYAYDVESRLVSATTPAHASITYKYDALGRRIEKNVDGTITKYTYDGDHVIVESAGDDTTLATYVYGPMIDECLRMTRGGNDYYYHRDRLGSVSELTDAAGDVVESHVYDVYGNVASAGTVGNPYLFTGRNYDEETGLYYYRARYYSAALGRFLSEDPVLRDVDLYTYVGNNPLAYTDPWGHAPGTRYSTPDAAARAASQQILGPSIDKDKEHGGWIYRNSDGTYSYTAPVEGSAHGTSCGPRPANAVADYHSHGAESGPRWDDEHFSPQDKQDNRNQRVNGYLVTPSGAMRRYNHSSNTITQLGRTSRAGSGGARGGGRSPTRKGRRRNRTMSGGGSSSFGYPGGVMIA